MQCKIFSFSKKKVLSKKEKKKRSFNNKKKKNTKTTRVRHIHTNTLTHWKNTASKFL